MGGMVPTVLIVDDHADFRRFVRQLLETGGFTVVGEAADASEARHAVLELEPEVVLLDIQLPDEDGLLLAQELRSSAPASAIVLTSSRERADFGSRLERASASGFITKADLSPGAVAAVAGVGVG